MGRTRPSRVNNPWQRPVVRKKSVRLSSLLLKPILVVQPAENRRRFDAVTSEQIVSMWTCRNFGLGELGTDETVPRGKPGHRYSA